MTTATGFCVTTIFGAILLSIGGSGLIWYFSLESPVTYFLIKTTRTIELLNLDIKEPQTLITDPNDITAFDYLRAKTIYYGTKQEKQVITSWMREFIKYQNLPEYSASWTKTAMATDYVSDKLYVLDGPAGKVYVTDLDGKHHVVLYSDLKDAIDIAVDPTVGLIFILQKKSILQGEMDGSLKTPKKIVDKPNLTAFTVDPENSQLFYAASGIITSYRYTTGVTMNKATIGQDVISMTVAKDDDSYHYKRLYFIKLEKPNEKSILSCILESEGTCDSITGHYSRPDLEEIKAYIKYRETPENKCKENNGGCQHLCLLNQSNKGYSCVCDDGWKLDSDQKNCTVIENFM